MSESIKLKFWSLAIFVATFGISMSQGYAQSCDAPNPNMPIAKPGPSVSSSAAAFSGVWDGTFMSQVGRGHSKQNVTRCYRLYVSVTNSASAAVAYCYGSSSYTGSQPQCDKYTATIAGNTLQFKTNIGRNVTFTSQSDNKLAAEVHSDAGLRSTQTEFHRE